MVTYGLTVKCKDLFTRFNIGISQLDLFSLRRVH